MGQDEIVHACTSYLQPENHLNDNSNESNCSENRNKLQDCSLFIWFGLCFKLDG